MPDVPAIKSTTQSHLDLHSIKDDLIILKDGSVAMVLQVAAINFGLLSEDEQDATIYAYASLLNSLSFTTQIVIRSTRKDISAYLERLDGQLEETRSQKIKEQIIKYRTYIKSLVKENKVMEKRLYVVIPFSALELGLTAKSFNPFTKPPSAPAYPDNYILEKAKFVLFPRRDHVLRQFARIGLSARQLTSQELATLFYRVYNPDTNTPPFITNPAEFETTTVEAIISTPPTPSDKPTTGAYGTPPPPEPVSTPTPPTNTSPTPLPSPISPPPPPPPAS